FVDCVVFVGGEVYMVVLVGFFFFKQKTAYEITRRDWSSDVCSSDLKKRSLEAITAGPDESEWAELREAQLLSTRVLPKVGLAVITDVGDKDDIHPTRDRKST